MSRSGYSDYYDDPLVSGRWRAQVNNATKGVRGQAFFRSLVEALDAMEVKRLINSPEVKTEQGVIYYSLGDDRGNICVLGALAQYRNLPVFKFDAEDHDKLGEVFNIAHQLAQEVMYINDEYFDTDNPETRWVKMRGWCVSQLKNYFAEGAN